MQSQRPADDLKPLSKKVVGFHLWQNLMGVWNYGRAEVVGSVHGVFQDNGFIFVLV